MFSNSTLGEMFVNGRCRWCIHRSDEDESCDDFSPVFWGEEPDILYRVEISEDNPVGVECKKFALGKLRKE